MFCKVVYRLVLRFEFLVEFKDRACYVGAEVKELRSGKSDRGWGSSNFLSIMPRKELSESSSIAVLLNV